MNLIYHYFPRIRVEENKNVCPMKTYRYKKVLGISLFIIGMIVNVVQGHTQKFTNVNTYKQFLIENYSNTDILEGIWQFRGVLKSGFHDRDPKNRNIYQPSFNVEIAPLDVAIIKISENNYFTYYVDILDNITKTNYTNYHFQSTAIEGQYLVDNIKSNGKAFFKSDGDLYFELKNEEIRDGVLSWDDYYITATKLSPTPAEIKNKTSHPKK